MKAIHNKSRESKKCDNVVSYIKDTNYWKQFTTAQGLLARENKLFRISKIPIIESNSQQVYKFLRDIGCCFVYQRYQLLKAIHNSFCFFVVHLFVVSYIKDTNYWKQFTTGLKCENIPSLLFRISKIPIIESNSQRDRPVLFEFRSCFVYQRYQLLKAIHNIHMGHVSSLRVVSYIKDTNYWKQFTTYQI